ncbi:MAG: RNA polymerase sigma factor [Dysgonamonadaceae bacterium]|jgi:RNA polymerase sigma-70 factor (ECF subfamily)|nr:RNA polymerase sigma factor [Dysgonamonadaceae bacterium]
MSTDKFSQVILPLKDKLFRLALSIVGDKRESEDIVQDVLLKLWTKKEEWDEIENLEAYCFRSTRNLAFDQIATANARLTDPTDLSGESLRFIDEENPHSQLVKKERLSLIEECTKELSDNQRLVFQLRDIEGMSYKEIAEIANISEELVKVSLFRARKKIREMLSNLDNYGIEPHT